MKFEKDIPPEKLRKTILVLGIIIFIHGLYGLYNPPVEPATGRWSWLINFLTSLFGKYTSPIISLFSGGLFITKSITNNGKNNKNI